MGQPGLAAAVCLAVAPHRGMVRGVAHAVHAGRANGVAQLHASLYTLNCRPVLLRCGVRDLQRGGGPAVGRPHRERGPRACRRCAAGCASHAHDHRKRRTDGTPRRAERRQRRQIAAATVLDIYFCNSSPPATRHRRVHQRPPAPVLPHRHRRVRARPATSTTSPPNSTTGPANRSGGEPPPKPKTSNSPDR
jgi:hypothetical protein